MDLWSRENYYDGLEDPTALANQPPFELIGDLAEDVPASPDTCDNVATDAAAEFADVDPNQVKLDLLEELFPDALLDELSNPPQGQSESLVTPNISPLPPPPNNPKAAAAAAGTVEIAAADTTVADNGTVDPVAAAGTTTAAAEAAIAEAVTEFGNASSPAPAALELPNTVFSQEQVAAIGGEIVATLDLPVVTGDGGANDGLVFYKLEDVQDIVNSKQFVGGSNSNVVVASMVPSTSKQDNDEDNDEDGVDDVRPPTRKRHNTASSSTENAKKKKYEVDDAELPDDPKERKKVRQAKNAKRNRDLAKAKMAEADKTIAKQQEEIKRKDAEIARLKKMLAKGCCRCSSSDPAQSDSTSDEDSNIQKKKPTQSFSPGKGGPFKGAAAKRNSSNNNGNNSSNGATDAVAAKQPVRYVIITRGAAAKR